MTRQLPVRIGYEYPARPRKHQVPCPHRQGVGYGAFCISGTCTPLERCNTLDFVPKLCAKGAAPLWNPCSHRLWAMWIRRIESSYKGAPRLFTARKRHFCGSVITHYDTFIPAACKVPWALRGGDGCIRYVSGESLRTCVRKVGTHVRSKTAKFSYIWVVI